MHSAPPVLLSGRIVMPDGDARQRYVLIRDGGIESITRSRPPKALLENATEVTTGPQDWIFPGLLDLHTHASYNILPLWRSPRAPFDNRFVWRGDGNYRTEVSGVSKAMVGHRAARQVFSELQAVAGGTCVLDQNHPLEGGADGPPTVLCRNTGSAREMGLKGEKSIRAVVDFFQPGPGGQPVPKAGWGDKPDPIDAYMADRDSLQATLVHLAEGRSGFGSDRGVDPYSRAEFEAFMAHPALADVAAVKASRLSIVHGCGIDVDDPKHIDFLVERGISVIWSPGSNLLLYGDTLDAETLIERGVKLALGSDWSPSGTKHVWDEAKFARFFLRASGATTSDADIFKMVTSRPASILGLPQLGRLAEGSRADLFVLRSPIESDSALEVFFATSDKDVLATMVNGLPLYGDKKFLRQWDIDVQPLPKREGEAVRGKVVHLPASVGVEDFAGEIDAVEDQLKAMAPPVFRSNLLVDSDAIYQRRFHALRSRVERFAWSVRSWRKHRWRSTVGEVPTPPSGVRVYVRATDTDRTEEVEALGAIRLPATVALGHPLGLACHTVAVLPSSAGELNVEAGFSAFDHDILDEASDPRVKLSLAGRLSGWIDSAGAQLWTGVPQAFEGTIEGDAALSLLDESVDWYLGDTRLTVWRRRASASQDEFRSGVASTLRQGSWRDLGWDGAILAVVGDLGLLWAHAPLDAPSDLPDEAFADVATKVMGRTARNVDAKGGLAIRWKGLSVRPASDLVRARFTRRALLPW